MSVTLTTERRKGLGFYKASGNRKKKHHSRTETSAGMRIRNDSRGEGRWRKRQPEAGFLSGILRPAR